MCVITYSIRYLFPASEAYLLYGETFAKIIILTVLLLILWWFGWLKTSGITRLGNKRIWLTVGVILCYKILIELYVFTGHMSFTVTDAASALDNSIYYFVGSLVEETMYRALILTAMFLAWGNSRRGVIKSILLSSVLFGFTHLLNIIVDPFNEVLIQSLVVILPGIVYAVIVLLGKSLWPAIIIHWITNTVVNIQLAENTNHIVSTFDWIAYALLLLPLMIYCVIIVLKSDFSS